MSIATKFLCTIRSANARHLLINRCGPPIVEAPHRDYRPATWDTTQKLLPFRRRGRPNKHWNPKFTYMRKLKVIQVNLEGLGIPSYERHKESEAATALGLEEMRSLMKKRGVAPTRPYNDRGRDRPIHVSSTSGIFEPYVPPEGDGRASRLSREGVGQLWDQVSAKSRQLLVHVRGVRKYDDEFDPKTFGENVALPIFVKAHEALMNRDVDALHEYVTEHAFTVMHDENRLRSIKWELVESIEPARVVHVRRTGVLHDDNIFGQVTVRMHTKQRLAIYDQFGRLYLGSEDIARDVLEYVVFERHLVDPHGGWRLHAKITPKWLPPKDAAVVTFRRREKKRLHDLQGEVESEFVPVSEEEDRLTSKTV